MMVLLPKALLRVKGSAAERLPGEPESAAELSRRIDAPVGDRSDWVPDWPELGPHFVPIGRASKVRAGDAATVLSYGRHLPLCAAAADEVRAETGLACDVIDLRSIFPYDWAAISESLARTGRLLIVNEDTEVTNFGEHLLRRAIDDHFYDLVVRPRLLMGKHVPGVGLNQEYERQTVPQAAGIKQALAELVAERA